MAFMNYCLFVPSLSHFLIWGAYYFFSMGHITENNKSKSSNPSSNHEARAAAQQQGTGQSQGPSQASFEDNRPDFFLQMQLQDVMSHGQFPKAKSGEGPSNTGSVLQLWNPQDMHSDQIEEGRKVVAGRANKGIYFVKNEAGEELVLKFTDEDPKRPAAADIALEAAGVNASGAYSRPMEDANDLLIKKLGDSEGDGGLGLDVEHAKNAKFVVIMKSVAGVDFKEVGDALAEPNVRNIGEEAREGKLREHEERKGRLLQVLPNVKAEMISAGFIQGMGRIFAADSLMGNRDRISAEIWKDNPAWNRGVFNSENFKIAAGGIIGAIDNDTQLFSRQFIGLRINSENVEDWVTLLIHGGGTHLQGNEQDIRELPSLEALFTAAHRKHIYDSFVVYLPGDVAAPEFNDWDTHFKLGIQNGLNGLLQGFAGLRQGIQGLKEGETETEGLDPKALEVKAAYLSERMRNWGREEAGTVEGQEEAEKSSIDLAALQGLVESLLPLDLETLKAPGQLLPGLKFFKKIGRKVERKRARRRDNLPEATSKAKGIKVDVRKGELTLSEIQSNIEEYGGYGEDQIDTRRKDKLLLELKYHGSLQFFVDTTNLMKNHQPLIQKLKHKIEIGDGSALYFELLRESSELLLSKLGRLKNDGLNLLLSWKKVFAVREESEKYTTIEFAHKGYLKAIEEMKSTLE